MSLITIQYLFKDSTIDYSYTTMLYLLIGILFPLNLLIFSLLKERGFFTAWGLTRFIVIAGEFFYISSILVTPGHKALDFLYREYLWAPFPIKLFPQLVGLVLGISLILILTKMYFSPSYSDSSFIMGMVIATFILLLKQTNALLILFSTFGILLTISIIRDSYRMSYLDELTGLPGRRALKEDMMKLSGKYTVAMLDIDFFKKFNDKHGHDIGDEVLKMVASTLGDVTGGGKAFRYGGEEFTILFPGKASSDALPHLESLREEVANRTFTVRSKDRPRKKPTSGGKTTSAKKSTPTRRSTSSQKSSSPSKKLKVTISIGVAGRTKETKSPMEVMKNADKALYRAKKKGRNCVSK